MDFGCLRQRHVRGGRGVGPGRYAGGDLCDPNAKMSDLRGWLTQPRRGDQCGKLHGLCIARCRKTSPRGQIKHTQKQDEENGTKTHAFLVLFAILVLFEAVLFARLDPT